MHTRPNIYQSASKRDTLSARRFKKSRALDTTRKGRRSYVIVYELPVDVVLFSASDQDVRKNRPPTTCSFLSQPATPSFLAQSMDQIGTNTEAQRPCLLERDDHPQREASAYVLVLEIVPKPSIYRSINIYRYVYIIEPKNVRYLDNSFDYSINDTDTIIQ